MGGGGVRKSMKLLLVLALVAAAAHGTRAARPAPGTRGGAATRAASRSLLSRPGPSCCTHDGNTVRNGCCPRPLPP
uniref:Uncharacterized protein n=1 Tax=Leersia perrieri TaxID=77586 RepID=A0A0D9VY81_9ORYZ